MFFPEIWQVREKATHPIFAILLSGSLENSVGLEMIYEDEEEERQVSIVSQVDDRPGTSSGRQKKLMSSRYALKPFQFYR